MNGRKLKNINQVINILISAVILLPFLLTLHTPTSAFRICQGLRLCLPSWHGVNTLIS